MPEAMQDPVIQGLRTELARQETLFGQIRARYGVNHPDYIKAKSDIDSTRNQIRQEATRIAQSLDSTAVSNQRREASIREALENQKSRVLKLNEQRMELAVLQRDVESAQRAYDAIMQRLAQTSLESQSDQTNLRILAHAVEPFKPSSPNIRLNVALSVFLGLGLGIAAALILEALDSKVRDIDDFARQLDLPVLGVIGGTSTHTTLLTPLLSGPARLISRLRLLKN
jgi:uncharacterized protein involved in exopolysaccharide biosynthesis